MTYGELLYLLALAAVGGACAYFVAPTRRDAVNVAIFFQASFWFRAIIAVFNKNLNFFVQKYASDFSIGLMDQKGGLLSMFTGHFFSIANLTNMKFFLEALINLPAVRVFEDSAVMLNFTNSFVGAAAGLIVFAYTRRMFNERVATIGLLLASLYPAALNFSFFALRDVIIYFFLLLNIFSFAWIVLRKDYLALNWAIYIVSFLCATILRVTFILFILIPPGWMILRWFIVSSRAAGHVYRRLFFLMLSSIIITIGSLVVLIASYFVVVHQVTGATTLVAPTVLFQDYALNRASRGSVNPSEYSPALGTGANSLYLPFGVYQRLPFYMRVPLQLFAFIDIPLPWQLTAVARILAMFDSIFVIVCMYWVYRFHRMIRAAAIRKRNGKLVRPRGPPLPAILAQYDPVMLERLSTALILAFIGSWFGFGVLVSDSGNAFRMRISVEPFLVFGACIYAVMAMRWVENRLNRAVARSPAPLQLAPGE
ncbi:MAG TPA: hypothetical protein VGF56_14125 [Rhizomicrobium sp.]|jgi:hypothetical protein